MTTGVKQTANGNWRARWRGLDNKERVRTFQRKADAVAFRAEMVAEKRRGIWVDPQGQSTKFSEFAEEWLASKQGLKPSSKASYAELLNSRVLPKWETWPVGRINSGEVMSWRSALLQDGLSPSRVNKLVLVVRQVLNVAVAKSKLPQNPLKIQPIKAVREPKSKPAAFTSDEVFLLAAIMPEAYQLATLFACYTGLRMSELVAVQVGDVNLKEKIVNIERATVIVDNVPVTGLPKSHEVREVPLVDFLVDRLGPQIKGRKKTDWLFPDPSGSQMIADRFRSAFMTRTARIGRPEMTPHNCRDTAASLAISLGASVKTVSVFMGHADPSITLNRYTAFFPKDYDVLRQAMSKSAREAEKRTAKKVASLQASLDDNSESDVPF